MSKLVCICCQDRKGVTDELEPSTLPPRPANYTSIPALLNGLQSEYDAIMLESLEIKKQYNSSRCVDVFFFPNPLYKLPNPLYTRVEVLRDDQC